MLVKGLIDEDFVNYKKPSMFVAFHSCTFKCEKDCGVHCCQNSDLATSPDIEIDIQTIVKRYKANPITSALVCGGLEPFDDWENLYQLIAEFRKESNDDVVIYTGYYPDEIKSCIDALILLGNIIIKFGRFIPDSERKYDSTLGVILSSDNQYSVKIYNKDERYATE